MPPTCFILKLGHPLPLLNLHDCPPTTTGCENVVLHYTSHPMFAKVITWSPEATDAPTNLAH